MKGILIAILVMVVLGFVLGLMVSFFLSKFKVEEDHRIDDLVNLLPGANCGACGYAGCHDYAKSILDKKAGADGCKVIKGEAKEKLQTYVKDNVK